MPFCKGISRRGKRNDVIHLVLSLDYEIVGSGSRDVRRDMIEPPRRLLMLCQHHVAEFTITLEAGECRAIGPQRMSRLPLRSS